MISKTSKYIELENFRGCLDWKYLKTHNSKTSLISQSSISLKTQN